MILLSIKEGGLGLRRFFKGISVYLLIAIVIMLLVKTFGNDVEQVKAMNVTELVEHLNNNEVESIKIVDREVNGKLKNKTQFTTILPKQMEDTFYNDYLKELVDNKQVDLSSDPDPTTPWLISAIPTILMVLGLGVLWFVL